MILSRVVRLERNHTPLNRSKTGPNDSKVRIYQRCPLRLRPNSDITPCILTGVQVSPVGSRCGPDWQPGPPAWPSYLSAGWAPPPDGLPAPRPSTSRRRVGSGSHPPHETGSCPVSQTPPPAGVPFHFVLHLRSSETKSQQWYWLCLL